VFDKILIANRGEIACRIARTARRLGVRTVAVFSAADAQALHVRVCDEAVSIGAAPARESYLRGEAIIDAARRTGAQAVHPGYGFLSENAEFAESCAGAGLVFIGPPPEAIRAMGSKSAAKALMQTHGVPLVPGFHGEQQDPERLAQEAARIGYPVLIKASAGGGGKGMRRVDDPAQFATALGACQREAIASFGDARMLIERYVLRPRHIEIQIFTDAHGGAVYLFERDCSVQRRHQKVLEEAPAPGMSCERRAAMGSAALAAARAVGYVGAGTVEFIAEPDGRFYFMEMNTRLQVEHPVTEMITRQDLVEWQLRVAAGEPLPCTQAQLSMEGHAIEARIYAEDPDREFLPATGRVQYLRTPVVDASVRIDAGVAEGDVISPWYDPMIAKLIVHADTRGAACTRLAQALEQIRILGVANNVAFLTRLVRSRSFLDADLDTALIEREHEAVLPKPAPAPQAAVLAGALALLLAQRAAAAAAPGLSVWRTAGSWRLNALAEQSLLLISHGVEFPVRVRLSSVGCQLSLPEGAPAEADWSAINAPDAGGVSFLHAGERIHAQVFVHGMHLDVFLAGQQFGLEYRDPLAHVGEQAGAEGGVRALMPGRVVALLVEPGARVEKGQPLLILEAMKMEHTLTAPAEGLCEGFNVAVGDQVIEGAVLVRLQVTAHAPDAGASSAAP
jgi:3-methylcrotonyl-CoA carboxylase alpha subunit